MSIVRLNDKSRTETFLRRDPFLHIYEIGDLDDFFWPRTTWYGLEQGDRLRAVVLLYGGQGLTTVLALAEREDFDWMVELMEAVQPRLPDRFYAHLSPGLEKALEGRFTLNPHGAHLKMGLKDPARVEEIDTSGAEALGPPDLEAVLAFYRKAYPGNWFEPRMLETNRYFGIRGADGLVSVAGVHVYSPRYRVAALGNIATLPEHRGRGHAKAVTAKLCRTLLGEVEHIGLNVKADNLAAIRCYERLGFEPVASYGEFDVERRNTPPRRPPAQQ